MSRKLERDVGRFNAIASVGMPVRYRKDDHSVVEAKLRTRASVLGGHTAVVWLDGVRGCVALDRVSIIAGDDDEFMGHPV